MKKLQKLLSFFLICAMLLPSIILPASAVEGGQNTESVNPYTPTEAPAGATPIASASDFEQMANSDADFVLVQDIEVWQSVPQFSGTLYGNGKTITTNVPLFTSLVGATVLDLTIEGEIISTVDNAQVAALAETADSATLRYVTSHATVAATGETSIAGGLLGTVFSTIIVENCITTGNISGTSNVGGIIAVVGGVNTGTISVSIDSCVVLGTLSNTAENIGGIVGFVGTMPEEAGYSFGVTRSVVFSPSITSTANASSKAAGGIVGNFTPTNKSIPTRLEVTSCAVFSDISSNAAYAAGIVGAMNNHKGTLSMSENIFVGSASAPYGDGAGVLARAYVGSGVNHSIVNNAVYASITSSEENKAAALLASGNARYSDTVMKNNVFVGELFGAASLLFATGSTFNNKTELSDIFANNYWYRKDNYTDSFYVYYRSETDNLPISRYETRLGLPEGTTYAMALESTDVSTSLNAVSGNDGKWTYVENYTICNKTYTFNIPVTAKAALDAAVSNVFESLHDFSRTDYDADNHWAKCSRCVVTNESTVEEHGYANNCDADCNVCGAPRTPSDHVYDNETCDIDCNVCGDVRTVPHDFSVTANDDLTYHWVKCSLCGAEKEGSRAEHDYGAAGTMCVGCGRMKCTGHTFTVLKKDETKHWNECSNCGTIDEKSVAEHSYTVSDKNLSEHWKVCSTCAMKDDSSVEGHKFSYVCDPSCDCGLVREIVHDFCIPEKDATHHWNACSLCGAAGEKTAHTFGEWTVEGDVQSRACDCGYVETKTVVDDGTMAEPDDGTTAEPDDDGTTAEPDDGTTAEPDDEETYPEFTPSKGCGSVVTATLGFAALALLAPAALVLRKKEDEE